MAEAEKLNVLWATDGSGQSLSALPLLRHMVLPVTGKLTVLVVAPRSTISGARPDPVLLTRASGQTKRHALIEAREAAEHEATMLDPDIPVEAISRWGHPIEEILRTATKVRAGLIVMAAKGHSDLRLMFLGSVTQGVAHHTTRPILVARPGAQDVDKVVVGYHGTSSAKRALAFLGRLALPTAAEIVVVTAIEPFALPEGTPPAYRAQALRESHAINLQRHKAAEDALTQLARAISTTGRKVTTEVLAGNAAEVLDEAARRHSANLLVLGSRRPKPESRFIFGTTAEQLMRHSHTSVLLVR